MKYNDDEINDLSYEEALLYDNRTFSNIYFSLIKTNHNFINSFIFNKDYNSIIIKIDLFLINFAMSYAVNAVFFTDDTMHKIYKSEGSFDLKNQLPITIYSTLISLLFDIPLRILALSSDAISSFKQDKNKLDIKKRESDLLFKLKIKYIFYFIISTLFLSFFWFYISMFDAIYINTQYHLLKDTLMGFAISMATPFAFYLLPTLIRRIALVNRKNNRRCLYIFYKILLLI